MTSDEIVARLASLPNPFVRLPGGDTVCRLCDDMQVIGEPERHTPDCIYAAAVKISCISGQNESQ